MGNTIGFKVVGMQKASDYLIRKKKEAIRQAEKGVKEATFYVESEVKQSIAGKKAEPQSVDTGRFLNSVKSIFPKKLVGGVVSHLDYAKHLEWGTSKMQPRKHFTNTKERTRPAVKNFINKQVRKI